MSDHVTKRSHPDLDWNSTPRGFWVAIEIFQSDAWRSLTKIESDLLMFIYSRRKYARKLKTKKEAAKRDYWAPLNGHDLTIPYVAIKEFFEKPGQMTMKAPNDSTISRALRKLMSVGFISVQQIGGNGKGDTSRYRLAYNWRTWKVGDQPCFEKAGMSREKGFCQPGSGVFCPTKINKGVQACMRTLHASPHEKNSENQDKGCKPA